MVPRKLYYIFRVKTQNGTKNQISPYMRTFQIVVLVTTVLLYTCMLPRNNGKDERQGMSSWLIDKACLNA